MQLLNRFKCWRLGHSMHLDDMGRRDTSGYLSWSCQRCGDVQRLEYGLQVEGCITRNRLKMQNKIAAPDSASPLVTSPNEKFIFHFGCKSSNSKKTPLTIEEIEIATGCSRHLPLWDAVVNIVRSVEAAHEIK